MFTAIVGVISARGFRTQINGVSPEGIECISNTTRGYKGHKQYRDRLEAVSHFGDGVNKGTPLNYFVSHPQ